MAAPRIVVDSRFPQFKEELERGVRRALAKTADRVVARAKQHAPVESGALRGSIRRYPTTRARGGGYRVAISAEQFYGLFLELGTGKRRRRKVSEATLRRRATPSGRRRQAAARGGVKPRRFLSKALRETKDELVGALDRELPG